MRREMLSLLFLSAQVYPLMKSLGLIPEQGVIVCAENPKVQSILVNDLKKLGAKQVKIKISKREKRRNYLLYFAQIQKGNREQEVLDFLDNDMAMNALLTLAYLPDYLTGKYNEEWFFLGEECAETNEKQEMYDQMGKLIKYIRENPALVYRELRLFSEETDNCTECYTEGKLWIMFKAATRVWCTFFRETHTEEETLRERQRLCELVDYFAEYPERFSAFDEIGDTVANLLINYVNGQSDIVVGDSEKVDSKLAEALEKKKGILEKGRYFYIPEELLRAACQPLENAVSFLKVKRLLYDEGYLVSNNARGGNYTTKLLVTNVYGYTCRPRFLKLRKEMIESSTTIGFRKENGKCLSEISITPPAS